MLVAMRDLRLGALGEIPAGQPVPTKVWDQLSRRTKAALLSVRKVVVEDRKDTAPRRGRKKA